MATIVLKQADIWLMELDPVRGHEQAGTRPVVLLSVNDFNQSKVKLVFACPLTTKQKSVSMHVCIDQKSGLDYVSFAKPEDTRSLSTQRLVKKIGRVSAKEFRQIQVMLKVILGI